MSGSLLFGHFLERSGGDRSLTAVESFLEALLRGAMLQVSRRHQPAACCLLSKRIIIVRIWVVFPDYSGTAAHLLVPSQGHLQTSRHIVKVIQTFLPN